VAPKNQFKVCFWKPHDQWDPQSEESRVQWERVLLDGLDTISVLCAIVNRNI